jgi:hypothetical protein
MQKSLTWCIAEAFTALARMLGASKTSPGAIQACLFAIQSILLNIADRILKGLLRRSIVCGDLESWRMCLSDEREQLGMGQQQILRALLQNG